MLAETERFVWLAGDNLYTGSRSKWKLRLNKIASGVDQQANKMNAQSHQMPYASHAESNPPPQPQNNELTPKCECWLQDCFISLLFG